MILLLLLLGTLLQESQGLHTNLQYQYDYTGTISTWLPNDPTQSSGAALRAVVALQLSGSGDILVKINDIEVGERNGKDACSRFRQEGFPYREMDPEDAALLQTPFLVHVNASQVSYMEVPPEPAWVNNIRRGIINTIPLVVLTGQHPSRLSFGLKEETMIGRCFNWYSMLKLTGHQAKVESKKLEEGIEVDVQREGRAESLTAPKGKGKKTGGRKKSPGKTRPPSAALTVAPIKDTLWILTRSLDDQQCKDKHFTMKINGNKESVERTQRSSEGTFVIRGEGAVVRLERAEVEGNIMIHTGNCDDEFIWTASKQTLQLTSVQEVEEVFSISYEAERRALSFSVAEGPRSTIKEKLLGLSPAAQQVEDNMAGVLEDLSIIRRNMKGEDAPEFLKVFQRLVERMTILSWTEIQDIISRPAVSTRDKYIIYQAVITSGRDEVLIPILEQIKNSSEYLLQFLLLQSPLTPVRNPALLPAMLEVVTKIGENQNTALSLLNIAKLANRYCLNSETGNLCDPGCDTDFILTVFLPMLSRNLYDDEKWKRIVTVQAVCALGSPYSIPYLQPIIQGVNNEDIDERINAISCLTNDHLPKTATEMVFDSLMPLMKNPTEFPEIRSMAFIVLTTWEPSLSWWEEVAISTWKEKSPQVVSVISSTLITLSEGSDSRSKSAKKVVHLAKHPYDSEGEPINKSIYLYMDEFTRNCQVRPKMKLAWLISTKSIFPSSIYWQLQIVTTMGTIQEEKGLIFANILQNAYKNMHSEIHSRKKNYEDQDLFNEIYAELTEELELILNNNEDEHPFLLGLLLEPLSILGVTNLRYFSDNILWILGAHTEDRLPVHLRMAELMLAFPSDLGLPIVVKHEEDLAFMFSVIGERKETVEANYNHRNVLKANTLVPWSHGMAVGVGFESSFDVNVMLTVNLSIRDGTNVVVLTISPEQKAKIISLSNVMYTSMTKLYHVVDSLLTSEEADSTTLGRRVIWNRRPKEGTDLLLPETGLHLKLRWTCDLEHSSYFTEVIKKVFLLQTVYQNFEYMLLVDLENSRTKSVTFTFKFDKKERDDRFPEQVTDYDGQVTQDLSDPDLFSQVPQIPSQTSGFDEFGEGANEAVFDRQQLQSSSFNNYVGRMQEMIMPSGTLYTAIMTVEPENSTKKYDVAVTLASSEGNVDEKGSKKIHVVFMESPTQGSLSDTHMTCLDVKVETPFVLPLLPKELLSDTDLTATFLVSLYAGGHCDGPAVMKMQGMFGVSPAAVQNIQSTEEDTCVGDFLMKSRLTYDQVIAAVTWTQDFRHLFKAVEALTLNQLQSLSTANVKSEGDRPGNELIVQATLKEEEWNVTITRPEVTSVFLVPDVLYLSPYDTFDSFEKVCHVTSDSVQTYDGLTYAFQGPSCWVTATIYSDSETGMLLEEAYNDLKIAVQVRLTDQWEVRLTAPSYAAVIDVTRSDILVNDEPLIGYNEKFVVHRLQNSMMIKIGMVLIRVGDTVDVMVSDLYYGAVRGICGNYDGEPLNDMMGPTGCLYSDPALYTLAWSTSARTDCRKFTLRNEKRVLSGYREECNRAIFQPTGLSQENVMKNCTDWKYEERQIINGLSCKSKVPHPECQAGCHQGSISTKQLGYSCRMPSLREENVQYGENFMCSNTVSPIVYSTACSSL
uniref:Vitellogenin domain-containing protein n=1 Tax=Scylla olivacea TaxID=85551 RepID=A0A0P4WWF6_SCYOL